ncbi:unnamed protein product [Peronospora destructor]|uniref:Uncharacterized protein n=1 Tax=Peronospora destructor TaxID=86335 RepID=A0AAV0UN87_9STRA|nr:unnamed protein product [Peronospora destructor]
MPTFLLPVTRRSLNFALLALDEHESVPDWSDTNDLREALGVCDGVILAASGGGDDVINLPSSSTDEWLQCEQNVALLVSKDHRVVKLSWTEGFVGEQSLSTVGRATWNLEEELKLRMGEGGTWAHNLTILRATMGMDAFLRGQLFDLVCGRTLSTSVKRGRIAFVHPLDVAESLSALVTKADIDGRGEKGRGGLCKLTGPESLHAGCTVSPGDAVEEEFAVIRALEAGVQQEVDTTFMETLLGHEPRCFRTFIAENVAAWPRTHPA